MGGGMTRPAGKFGTGGMPLRRLEAAILGWNDRDGLLDIENTEPGRPESDDVLGLADSPGFLNP
jgi:hypothetical protein